MKSVFKIFLLSFLFFIFIENPVFSATISELEKQIEQRNNDLVNLQNELGKLQKELSSLNSKSNTLSKSISELEVSRKKLLTEIQITQSKIGNTNDIISELEIEIGSKETSINKNKKAIETSIKKMHELDSMDVSHIILSQKTLSEALNEINNIVNFQKELKNKITDLKLDQNALIETVNEKEKAKKELLKYKTEVDAQKEVVEKNKQDKTVLLKETKNQESEYQKIIAEKEKLRAQFEAELAEYESKLQFILDPKTIPEARNGVFNWPLDNILITQGFGLTKDSAKLYSHRQGAWKGKHTGIDFRANNDKVYAMASGTVVGFGNTDLSCPRASFGGWVLIKYDNGLSSIYSHLSTIVAKKGDKVLSGDLVAYSGNTGYSTGPHLDVKIVPSEAVTIQTWPSKGCPGKNYTTPIVAGGTYLDPLLYLPKTTDVMWK